MESERHRDPYRELAGVQFLDEQLGQLRRRLHSVSERAAQCGDLTELETAALELIPSASSMANSVRVLLSEGYLVSAAVLFRPTFERVATLSYLARYPEAVALWRAGWPHGARPSLAQRIATLLPVAPGAEHILKSFTAAVVAYNSMVHGDPLAAQQSVVQWSGAAYALDRDLGSPQRASTIAVETAVAVVFLSVTIDRVFRLSEP